MKDTYSVYISHSFYNNFLRNAAPSSKCKYAGAISNTVLHPLIPSLCILYAALAYATSTDGRHTMIYEVMEGETIISTVLEYEQ